MQAETLLTAKNTSDFAVSGDLCIYFLYICKTELWKETLQSLWQEPLEFDPGESILEYADIGSIFNKFLFSRVEFVGQQVIVSDLFLEGSEEKIPLPLT